MGTQRSEKRFRESLQHSYAELEMWYMKLQVNQMAHTKNVADFLVHVNKVLHAVEIKEIKTSDRFAFSRLSQARMLREFDNTRAAQYSWVLLNFWKGSVKKSKAFLIPFPEMLYLQQQVGDKKSANITDIMKCLPHTELQHDGKHWELKSWFG